MPEGARRAAPKAARSAGPPEGAARHGGSETVATGGPTMHAHEHESGERDTLRPRSRLEAAPDATLLRAAVAGRADVLGSDGMLRLQRTLGNMAVQRVAGEEE